MARHDSVEHPLWPGRRTTLLGLLGGLLALYVFMADGLQAVLDGGGVLQLRDLLPIWFNWPLFLIAFAFIAAPVLEVVGQVAGKPSRVESRAGRVTPYAPARCPEKSGAHEVTRKR